MSRKLAFKPRVGRAERRGRIEAAAAETFAEKGFEAASLDEIAAAAGITKTTLYDHFPSKRALYEELLAAHATEMVAHMSQRVAQGSGHGEERVREVVDAFFRFVQERPFAWRMLFRDPPGDAALAEGARAIHERATENVAALLRQLEPSRRRLPERRLRLRAEALKAAQQGLAAWWYEHPEVPRSELVDAIVEMVLAPGAGERSMA